MKNKVLITVGVLLLITAWLAFSARASNDSYTEVFCAYNNVFVEFDNNGHKWGTMLLDRSGRPIPCDNEIEKVTKEYYDQRI